MHPVFMPCLHSLTLWDLLRIGSESLRVLLDPLAKGQPESLASLPALPEICLSLGALLLGERLCVREADPPPAFLDRDDDDLELAPHGKRPAQVGAARRVQLGDRHEPRLPWTETHEDAEALEPL